MKMKKRELYRAFTKDIKAFGLLVIAVETITYTFSFLMSGIAKKDIFNVVEGKDVTLGIYSLNILILINVMVPLIINCVKQVNSAFVEKWKTKARYNVKSVLLNYAIKFVLNDSFCLQLNCFKIVDYTAVSKQFLFAFLCRIVCIENRIAIAQIHILMITSRVRCKGTGE